MTTSNKISVDSPEFIVWLAACQQMIDDQLERQYGSPRGQKLLVAEQGSKFIRVLTVDGQRMAWAFVAREDNTSSKTLGAVKRGDIHKCASWKAPSKTARGNILLGGTGGVTRWTGPDYLK